ncbi:MAG: hypothetical protein KGN77_17055, partial [Xanthomonadaceae bacterium]|nr:hypothetical protein [Xanthomonadaceae bacterium]
PTTGIRLVSPGGKDVQTEPDSRAAHNLAVRRARQAAAKKQQGGSQPQPQAGPQAPPDLEDWEIAARGDAPVTPQPVAQVPAIKPLAPVAPSPQPLGEPEGADILERARLRALRALAALPAGCELFVGSGLDATGTEFVLGLGLLVGEQLAAYHGNNHYRLTERGRALTAGLF